MAAVSFLVSSCPELVTALCSGMLLVASSQLCRVCKGSYTYRENTCLFLSKRFVFSIWCLHKGWVLMDDSLFFFQIPCFSLKLPQFLACRHWYIHMLMAVLL